MEKFIDLDALSAVLGLHHSTIRKMVKRGEIPFYRAGKTFLFDLEEVKNAIRKPVKSEVRNG